MKSNLKISNVLFLGVLCLFWLIPIAQSLPAQNQNMELIFEDNFDDNRHNWGEDRIKNGKLHVWYTVDTNLTRYVLPIPVNPKKDFIIETAFAQTGGKNTNGIGLVWGNKDPDNNYNFIIASNGKYKVYAVREGKTKVYIDWTKSNIVKPGGANNKLTVARKGETVTYYVNGTEIGQFKFEGFFGVKIGFLVYGITNIEVDYLKVYQEYTPINLIKNMPRGLKKENLGAAINSSRAEIQPIISHDGKLLFVTRDMGPKTEGGTGQDVFFSNLQPDGSWSVLQPIGKPINNQNHNSVNYVLPDNNSILVSGRYNSDGSPAGVGFSISHRKANGWTTPQFLEIDDYYNNSKYANACLSPDGRVMVMAIDRKDSEGDQDLYVSFKKGDNKWSAPQNMGPVINSFAIEATPFIAGDGQTIYFSSSGHKGYGDADIFVSRRLDDSWTNWSVPENLGPEINSQGWDAYYTVTADGKYAYLVSTQGGLGREDIYRLELPLPARPKPVVIVVGKVFNSKTKAPMEATITYSDLEVEKQTDVARSAPGTGDYRIILTPGKKYGFRASQSGFISISDNLDVTNVAAFEEIRRDLYLTPIEVGNIARINNLFFERGKAVLLSDSKADLDQLYELLRDNPGLKLEISGHTDNRGSDEDDYRLSEERAELIKKEMLSRGVSAERLVTKGYGKTRPIADNSTEEGRAQNRRVEIKVLAK